MGELSSEISDLLSDYVPPEETDEETEDELDEQTSDETGGSDKDETSEDEEEDSASEEDSETEETAEEQSGESEDEEDDLETETEDSSESDEGDDQDDKQRLIDTLNSVAAGKLELGEGFDEPETERSDKTSEEKNERPDNLDQDVDLDQQQQSLPDFDEVVSKPEAFQRAVETVVRPLIQQIYQDVMQNVVQSVGYQVQQQLSLKQLTDQFWADNEDLTSVKPYVAMVASTIQSKKPDKPIDEIFADTAKIVRAKLGLKSKGGDGTIKTRKRTKPALVKSTKASRNVPKKGKKLSKEQQQIVDLVDGF